jgi:hypothetical protein
MSMEDFLLHPSPLHAEARLLNGIQFLTDLKKTAAPNKQVASAVAPAKQVVSTAVSALSTKIPPPPTTYPIAAGQRLGVARASKPRTPAMQKAAALQYAPSAAKNLFTGLGSGIASDFRGLTDSAEGYRAGINQFTNGKATKPDLGGKFSRLKAWVTGNKTPEQMAYARGPAYYAAFIRAKNAQKGVGAGDLIDELNVSMRNHDGKFTPFSMTRGALGSGLVGADTLANVGTRSLAHITGTSAEAVRSAKMKRIAAGVGIGGGGLLAGGMIGKEMQRRNANAE